MSVLTANQKIAVVGHLLRYPDGRIQHGGTHRVPNAIGFPHLDSTRITEPSEMEAVTAASMLVRKDAFNAVGGFDESYFMYLEDTDLCLKLRTSGYMVYYTPYAQGIHEGSASSKGRLDLKEIINKSTSIFTAKWKRYFELPPPVFESFEVTAVLSVEVIYVTVQGNADFEKSAQRFVDSAIRFPPGKSVNWVIILNNPSKQPISGELEQMFSRLGKVKYFYHDNSGWDIGAFQAYCSQSKADIVLFLGSRAYCRRDNWLSPMINAFRVYGDSAIYGVCGNLGNPQASVSPHIRTTGFWCAPRIFNRYPISVTRQEQRYPFEHGQNGLTMWAWSQGLQALIVDADGIWNFPMWNDGPEGYHRGSQKSLLMGDRLCEPPYFHTA
jgi:hypothetical protein